jgi:beta-glucosidase
VRGKAWEGFVMSDWGATHSTSIKQGLDIEMPGAGFMNQEKIGAQLKAGIIDESVVDESVMRILTTM